MTEALSIQAENEAWILNLIEKAYLEDLPGIDLTTDNLNVRAKVGTARVVAKSDLVLSGQKIFTACVNKKAPDIQIDWFHRDSVSVLKGQTVCTLVGDLIPLLKAERVALNFLQHLSGIATLTSQFVALTQGTKCKILDTRKTIPGFRYLQKQAVVDGGGINHRMNLSAAIMIKDNHIALSGGITNALNAIRAKHSGPICVECASIADVNEVIPLKPERILLDNLSISVMRQALDLIPSEIEVEASGNMSLDQVREIAAIGIDFISVGKLTHSAPAADLSLLFDWST